MAWRTSHSPEEFSAAGHAFLPAAPERHTVFLTTLTQLLDGHRFSELPMHFAWYDAGAAGVTAAAMLTPPFPLLLTRMPAALLPSLVEALRRAGAPAGAVNADPATARAFAALWHPDRTGEVDRRQRLYRLARLRRPDPPPRGSSRRATPADLGLVADWFVAFDVEAHANANPARTGLTERLRRHIAAGRMRLWQAGGRPVAMAGRTSTEGGVARVGPVYTPPEHRRHGYGTAVTADVTADALAEGAAGVVLFTDLANPTSNSIYRQIGYEPVEDRVILRFH